MPWKDTRPVDQRLNFVEARLSGEHSMVALCLMFGISAKTGYKRWEHSQFKGLVCVGKQVVRLGKDGKVILLRRGTWLSKAPVIQY